MGHSTQHYVLGFHIPRLRRLQLCRCYGTEIMDSIKALALVEPNTGVFHPDLLTRIPQAAENEWGRVARGAATRGNGVGGEECAPTCNRSCVCSGRSIGRGN